jgi:ribonuclease D
VAPLPHIIARTEDLAELAATLATREAIGVDTEFMRERTYRAELCLVQTADGMYTTCVDPLALTDLAPLARVLAADRPVKVLHAARQDLEVLAPIAPATRSVFDTQVAAALAGHPAQIGYAELARRLLGVELHKAHTRTDWSRRPLSEEQIEYAREDVLHLLPLRERLLESIERLGRAHWLEEEMRGLGDPQSHTTDPEEAWRRVRSLQGIGAERRELARALAAWRERRAVAKNRPRGWILADPLLREIVVRVPRDPAQLAAMAEVPPAFVRNCGEEVLEIVRQAGLPDPPPPLPRRERPDPAQVARMKRLTGVLQQAATRLGICAEVLATRRDLERLMEDGARSALLCGWRREVIGLRLLEAL